MKKIVAGVFLFFLMAAMVAPVFAAEEEAAATTTQGVTIQLTVLAPAKAALVQLGGYLPKLGGLLLILVIGSLLAVAIAALIRVILKAVKLEQGAKKIKIPDVLKKGGIKLSLSDLITEIIFFLIIIGTLITALEFYGLATNPLTSQILSYLPHVFASVFILVLGIFIAIFISGIITLVGGNVKIAQSAALAQLAKYAIIIFAGLIALKELGLGVILTDNSKNIILGGLVLGLVLAFGLGAKDKVSKFLDSIF